MSIVLLIIGVFYATIGISLFLGLMNDPEGLKNKTNIWERVPTYGLMSLLWPVGLLAWMFSKKYID